MPDRGKVLSQDKMQALVKNCVRIAKLAWWDNFSHGANPGDYNRMAIGRLADSVVNYYLDNSEDIPVELFMNIGQYKEDY